jgi:opacity protein-like surface antigen
MSNRLFPKLTLALFFVAISLPAFSQVAPSATSGGPLWVGVGAGFADVSVDFGQGRMEGGSLWVDVGSTRVPPILRGFAIEGEARDINIGARTHQPKNFREDTAGGGPVYYWRHYRNFQPYGKFLIGYGSIDFEGFKGLPDYKHDTRTVFSEGGGLEYRIFKQLWARGDYSYMEWPHLFSKTNSLSTQGFEFGAIYEFRHNRYY